MPITLNSLIVGDWKSLLSNFGGTGPDPTMGWSVEGVVLLVDAAVLEEEEGGERATETEGELEGGDVEEGSTVAGVLEAEIATFEDESAAVGVDEEEAPNCACLACFLAAAFVCQLHEHGLAAAEGVKNDPCRHFLIAAIAAKTSLFDGFWPLPVNTGLPSARSINCSPYRPTPRKWYIHPGKGITKFKVQNVKVRMRIVTSYLRAYLVF